MWLCLIQTELQPNPTRREESFWKIRFVIIQLKNDISVFRIEPDLQVKVSYWLCPKGYKLYKGDRNSSNVNLVGVVEAIQKYLFAVRNLSQLAYSRPVGQIITIKHIYTYVIIWVCSNMCVCCRLLATQRLILL